MTEAIFAPDATADLEAAVEWIAREQPAAANRFAIAVLNAARIIGEHPEIGPTRLEFAPGRYRFYVLKRYSYLMVYEALRRPPRIVRIVHSSRNLRTILAKLPRGDS